MTTEDESQRSCRPDSHDFLVKKSLHGIGPDASNYDDVQELYCRNCGMVCILTQKG